MGHWRALWVRRAGSGRRSTALPISRLRLCPLLPWSGWSIGWAAAIALLRIVTGIIGFIKYKAVPFRHTVANKVAGLLLYGLPDFALVLPFSVAILLLGAAATLASAEELALTLLSPALNRDEKGLLWRGKNKVL